MKTTLLAFFGIIFTIFTIVGCQRNSYEIPEPPNKEINVAARAPVNEASNPVVSYSVELIRPTYNPSNGTWEWIWAITNNYPGNGNNGSTLQDLSHWGMEMGSCFEMSSIVNAAYSSDRNNWTSFTPNLSVDPSASCMVDKPVLKFDFGTSGTKTSYYRLVLNKYYYVSSSFGYFKSGKRTGCFTFYFNGIGCDSGV